jgi:8-oxo-dGTP pyrophosphatase MutT (NUDIX family)
MMRRTKEPFYGYWGFHGGKIKFTQFILECAKQELKEETGLTCDLELKGLHSFKTFNNKELSYNHELFIVKATNPRGRLNKVTREGENAWFTFDEMMRLAMFPDTPLSLKTVQGKGFRHIEAERFQENDTFKKIKVVSDKNF